MEILGSTFDDSVFTESRDRMCESLSSYNAKMCEPEWFCENATLNTDDCLERQKVCKFRGDLAVRQRNYQSKEASNTCHLTSLLLLKVSIYQHFGAVELKISCLQQLCSLLPFNPWHWFSLGQTRLQLLDSSTTAGTAHVIPQ